MFSRQPTLPATALFRNPPDGSPEMFHVNLVSRCGAKHPANVRAWDSDYGIQRAAPDS
jgi:hypothetical protein